MALSNEQYNRLARIYEDRQRENDRYVREQKRILYLKVPELSEIDSEISKAAIDEARSAIYSRGDPSGGIAKAGERIRALSEKKERMIRAAGIPEDFLTPRYVCADCKDTGYIGSSPCHCFAKEAAKLSFADSGLPMSFNGSGLEDFRLDLYSKEPVREEGGKSPYDSAKAALYTAKSFIDNFKSEQKNLLMYGPPGVGKTFLSSCIATELMAGDAVVLYLSAFSLFDVLKEGTFAKPGVVPENYRLLFSCDLLIIDDLGTEFSNSLTNSQLFTLINERILNGNSTILSTNLPLSGIKDAYTERLFSRFLEHYSLIHLFGRDIRLMKKLGRQAASGTVRK